MQNVCLSIQMNIIKDLKGFFVKGCKDSQDQTKKQSSKTEKKLKC